jgi:hypothetical protein
MKLHPQDEYWLFDSGNPLDLPYFQRALNESGAKWTYEKGGILGKFSRNYGWGQKARSKGLDIYHGLSNELPFGIHRTALASVVSIHDLIFEKLDFL